MRSRPGARRPWIHGLVAAMLAVLFVGTGAIDAYGLHRCPHHDALPGDTEARSEAHDTHAHGAGHADATGDHAGGGHGEEGDGEHGPCSCIGLCGAASTALPGVAAGAPRLAQVTFDAPAARSATVRVAARADYLLPFANAPPFVR